MKGFFQYIKEVKYILIDGFDGLWTLFFLFLVSSALELIGISIIVPYVSLISNADVFFQTQLYLFIESFGFSVQANELLIIFGWALLVIFFVKLLSLTLINYLIYKFCFNKAANLKSYLMNGYQNMSFLEYSIRNSSQYIHNVTALSDGFSIGTLQVLLRVASEIIIILFIFIFLALNNFYELAILAGVFLLLFVVYDTFFKSRLIEFGRLSNKYSRQLIQGVNEGIEGMKEIRILGREKYFYNKVHNSAKKFAKVNIISNIIINLPRGIIEFLMVSLIVLLVFSAIILESSTHKIMPTLVLFGIASIRLIPSASVIISGINTLRNRRNANALLYNDIKLIKSRINSVKEISRMSNDDSFKVLSLDAVSFKYPKVHINILDNISLNIKSGDSIGIIGASGCGKTTLINLILGLLEPQSGKISYNGNVLMNNDLDNWRSHIAYLPQQIFLIDDTLRNNVALGVSNVDEKKLITAINQAQLGDFLANLPNGVDSFIGERGVLLSGGQRQRIALARAFYHDRDVLIMDEATSALDNDTEREVVDEIKRLKGKKTIIVIAHRITTLRFCDVIYKLDNGKIDSHGDYNSIAEGYK
jgi:ABC-type multidrug transport system fused ATPase/permease subunit